MSAPIRLAAFGPGLVAPAIASDRPAADVPGGLQVSDRGYRLHLAAATAAAAAASTLGADLTMSGSVRAETRPATATEEAGT